MINEYGTIVPDVVEFGERGMWPKGAVVVGPFYCHKDNGEALRLALEKTGGQWLLDELNKKR
jgi:hypothetical protein